MSILPQFLAEDVGNLGGIYTVVQAEPVLMLDLAWARQGLLHLHLQSGPKLNQKSWHHLCFKCFVCLLYLQITDLCSRHQTVYSGMQATLSPTPEPSWARLASVRGQPSVNALSCAQRKLSLGIVASVDGPLDFFHVYIVIDSGL